MLTNNARKKNLVRNGVYFTILTYKIFKKGKFAIFFRSSHGRTKLTVKAPLPIQKYTTELLLIFSRRPRPEPFSMLQGGGMANIGQKSLEFFILLLPKGMPLLENINMAWRDTATSKSHYFEIRAENGSLRKKHSGNRSNVKKNYDYH